MSKTLDLGPNNSVVSGVPSLTFPVAVINYQSDFGLVLDDPGVVVYTDLTSETDQQWTLRITRSERANIYAGSDIQAANMLPSKGGIDVYVEARGVARVQDTVDPTYLRFAPLRASFGFTLPKSAPFDATVVKTMASRVLAGLFHSAEVSDDGIEAILRGALRK